jgi:hypothetical protein
VKVREFIFVMRCIGTPELASWPADCDLDAPNGAHLLEGLANAIAISFLLWTLIAWAAAQLI